MMIHEFAQRTGYTPTLDEYRDIEQRYYTFDGGKDEFCCYWLERQEMRAHDAIISAVNAKLNELFKREGHTQRVQIIDNCLNALLDKWYPDAEQPA